MNKNEFLILIAEDDVMVRDVILKFLNEVGYTVVVAHDGLEAIEKLQTGDIHLVLTDLRMPGADGMQVLRAAMKMNPKTAVVLLTAYGTLDTALEAMKEGAYDYIVKPFVMQQLLLVVRNAYAMANLMEENEQLAQDLKEAHRTIESIRGGSGVEHGKKQEPRSPESDREVSAGTVDRIEKLRALNIIDDEEAKILKNLRSASASPDSLKKYSSLINNLKNE